MVVVKAVPDGWTRPKIAQRSVVVAPLYGVLGGDQVGAVRQALRQRYRLAGDIPDQPVDKRRLARRVGIFEDQGVGAGAFHRRPAQWRRKIVAIGAVAAFAAGFAVSIMRERSLQTNLKEGIE